MYETLLIFKGKEIKFKRPENPLSEKQAITVIAIVFFVISLIFCTIAIIVKISN